MVLPGKSPKQALKGSLKSFEFLSKGVMIEKLLSAFASTFSFKIVAGSPRQTPDFPNPLLH